MKKLLVSLLLLAGIAYGADTTTTRLGAVKPELGSVGWAAKVNSNFDLIDSSVAVLTQPNTYTQPNAFTSDVSITYLDPNKCVQTDANRKLVSQSCVTPPGDDTQVIYNQGGTFAGDSDFTFNGTTATITGVVASSATLKMLTWADGSVSTTAVRNGAAGAAGADGTSVYPATATASFIRYGLAASTITVSTVTLNGVVISPVGTSILQYSSALDKSFITVATATVDNLSFSDGTRMTTAASGTGVSVYPATSTILANNGITVENSESIDFLDSDGNTGSQIYNPYALGEQYLLIDSPDGVGINKANANFPGLSVTTVDVDTITASSVTITNLTINGTCFGCGGISDNLPGASTSYVQASGTLQSGATFYVSSGTVAQEFHVVSKLPLAAGVPKWQDIKFLAGNSSMDNGPQLMSSAGLILSANGANSTPSYPQVNLGSINDAVYGTNPLYLYSASGAGLVIGPTGLVWNKGSGAGWKFYGGHTGGIPGTDHYLTVKGSTATAISDYTLSFPARGGDNGEILASVGTSTLNWTTSLPTLSVSSMSVSSITVSSKIDFTDGLSVGKFVVNPVSVAAGNWDTTSHIITAPGHGLLFNTQGYLSTTGSLPSGLSPSTLYYVIWLTSDTFALGTTYGNSSSDVREAFTTQGSGVHTFTPISDPAIGLTIGATTMMTMNGTTLMVGPVHTPIQYPNEVLHAEQYTSGGPFDCADITVNNSGTGAARFIATSGGLPSVPGSVPPNPNVQVYMIANGHSAAGTYWTNGPMLTDSGEYLITGATNAVNAYLYGGPHTYFWNDNATPAFHFNKGTAGTEFATISASGTALTGTITNDDAKAGFIGEILSSSTYSFGALAPANGVYGDLVSLVLTPGDWDVSVFTVLGLNGAGSLLAGVTGVATSQGASFTNAIYGQTVTDIPPATGNYSPSAAIPRVRYSVASNTTVYLKVMAAYSTGTPKFYGTLNARRER